MCKSLIILLITAQILLTSKDSSASEKLIIATCQPYLNQLVTIIGENEVISQSLINASQDSHEVTKIGSKGASFLKKANLLICNGANLEEKWLEDSILKSRNIQIQDPKRQYFIDIIFQDTMIEVPLQLTKEQQESGMNLDLIIPNNHPKGNPHFHLDPNNLLKIADHINEILSKIDPKNAKIYQANYQKFITKLKNKITKWQDLAKPLKDFEIIILHQDFSYLINWLDLKQISQIQPSPGMVPNDEYIKLIITKAKPNKTPIIISYKDTQLAFYANRVKSFSKSKIIKLPHEINTNPRVRDLFALYDEIINSLLKEQQKQR